MFEVTVEQTFAAGHALRNYKGKCENVHGHNFKVQVRIGGRPGCADLANRLSAAYLAANPGSGGVLHVRVEQV